MKTTEKKTPNKRKKPAFKPVYVVDFTNVEDASDMLAAFALAKQGAGLAITDEEFDAVITQITDFTVEQMFKGYNCVALIDGQYMRFNIKGLSKEDQCTAPIKKNEKKNFFTRAWNKLFH